METEVKFIYSLPNVGVINLPKGKLQDRLEPAVYEVGFSIMEGYYLTRTGSQYDIKHKQYGEVNARSDRIIRAYSKSTKSFGALATGVKGTGKSELVKTTANKAINKLGLPVIVINSDYSDEAFQRFMGNVGECVIIIDEFGKKYRTKKDNNGNISEDPQGDMLSFFDGMQSVKRLILLTENNTRLINEYMLNRPSRLWYHFTYDKLEAAVINEYIKDVAPSIDNQFIADLVVARESSKEFTFDMLQAIVTEKLEYPEDSLEDLIKVLNVDIREPDMYLTNIELKGALVSLGVLEGKKISYVGSYYIGKNSYRNSSMHISPTNEFASKFNDDDECSNAIIDLHNTADKEALKIAVAEILSRPSIADEAQLKDNLRYGVLSLNMINTLKQVEDDYVIHAESWWAMKATLNRVALGTYNAAF